VFAQQLPCRCGRIGPGNHPLMFQINRAGAARPIDVTVRSVMSMSTLAVDVDSDIATLDDPDHTRTLVACPVAVKPKSLDPALG
jgi:hypothetical protein